MSDYTKWYLSFHNKKDNNRENIETINRHIKKITFGVIPTLIKAQSDENNYPLCGETIGCSLNGLENQLGLLRPLISVSKKMPDVILYIEGIGEYGNGDDIFIKNGLVTKTKATREKPKNWKILNLKRNDGEDIRYDWKKRLEEIKNYEKYEKTRHHLSRCAKRKDLIEDIMQMPKDKQQELFKYIKEFLKKNA